MKKIIKERVIRQEEQVLTEADIVMLTTKRNKQVRYLLLSYLPLALIILYVWLSGPASLYHEKFPGQKHVVSEKDTKNFELAAPYACLFFFLILTIFFFQYYMQTAAPLIKDIKNKKKLLLFIRPEKTEMAFFNKYYITTPIAKKQLVQIDKEDFFRIREDDNLVLEIAPNSQTVLRLTHDQEEILFY